jgi:DNA-binding HxlR family transcriptional regulator
VIHVTAELNMIEASPPEGLAYCPVFQHVMELLGRRWTGVIIRELLNGPARFSDLKRSIPGLTDRLLSDRLDELEQEDLVIRCVVDEGANKGHRETRYRLTERGEDLRTAIDAVGEHAARWANTCHLAERPGRRA